MLIINEGFPVTILSNEITELEGESQVSYLLAKALKKQQELRAKFLEKGEKTMRNYKEKEICCLDDAGLQNHLAFNLRK